MPREEDQLPNQDTPPDDGAELEQGGTPPIDEGGTPPDDQGGQDPDAGDGEPSSLDDAVASALKGVAGEEGETPPQGDEPPADDGQPSTGDQPPAGDQPPTDQPPAGEEDVYAMPEGLKERQQQRFQKLVDLNKTKDAQLQDIGGRFQGMQEAIQSTGANPQEITALLSYARLIHSDNPEDLNTAYELITHEQTELAKRLGRQSGDYDPLQEFPDLQQEVENLDITRERALEIAQARKAKAHTDARNENERQHNEQQSQWLGEVENGRNLLNALSAKLQEQDPDFQQKMAMLQPALEGMAQTIHPKLWVQSVAKMYRAAGDQLQQLRASNAPRVPGRAKQPLGGTSSRGEGSGTPQSFESAIMAGLKKAGGTE